MADSTVVMFINWSKEPFIGYWDSIPYPFEPGAHQYMEAWKARHFAKHLANRELIRDGLENDTSPKPDEFGNTDNPNFNLYLNRALVATPEKGESSQVQSKALDMNAQEEVPVKVAPVEKKKPGPKKKVNPAPVEAEFEGVK